MRKLRTLGLTKEVSTLRSRAIAKIRMYQLILFMTLFNLFTMTRLSFSTDRFTSWKIFTQQLETDVQTIDHVSPILTPFIDYIPVLHSPSLFCIPLHDPDKNDKASYLRHTKSYNQNNSPDHNLGNVCFREGIPSYTPHRGTNFCKAWFVL